MKVAAIKQLCEQYDEKILEETEMALLEEKETPIEVPGDDEGEKLTHVMAALWVKKEMGSSGCDINLAVRNYTQKVRKSIS